MSSMSPCFMAEDGREALAGRFRADVLRGLSARNKRLASQYFYDPAGARLFDRICTLPEYYLTRTELDIMRRHAGEMAGVLGPGCLLIEYGSGTSLKTRVLLDHLDAPAGYVPIDVAREHLAESSHAIAAEYPGLIVRPVCADFTRPLNHLWEGIEARRRVVYFPGSTIGNFTPRAALRLLRRSAALCGRGGGLLLGADLKKDPAIIEAAYNDSQGVTAAFNLNLLERINRELGADLQLDQFWHHAPYNPRQGRIEMHLVSRKRQRARLDGYSFVFAEGESICTEYSYKYTLHDLHVLGASAGFTIERAWVDECGCFSVNYFAVGKGDQADARTPRRL